MLEREAMELRLHGRDVCDCSRLERACRSGVHGLAMFTRESSDAAWIPQEA